jgi:hypothetical protein
VCLEFAAEDGNRTVLGLNFGFSVGGVALWHSFDFDFGQTALSWDFDFSFVRPAP